MRQIVVPLDGSTFAEQALHVAETLATAFKSEITVVSVVHAGSASDTASGGRTALESADVAEYLLTEASRLERVGIEANFTLRRGEVAAEVDTLASDLQADVIVLATHGRSGVERLLRGSVAHDLMSITDTPVLLIRPTESWKSRSVQFRRILVSLDGSEGAEGVLRFVRAIARQFDSEIVLLSVPERDAEKEMLERYLTQVATALQMRGHKVRTLITGSVPAQTIVDAAVSEKADLVMMATRGRGARATGVDLGTVTDRVVHETRVPVFVVPIRRASRDRRLESIESEDAPPEPSPAPPAPLPAPAYPPANDGGTERTS